MKNYFSTSSFVGGFMLGALFVGIWAGSSDFTLPLSLASSPSVGGVNKPVPESGAIAISSQPAGRTVTIDSVTVPPPGVWVAIREVSGTDLGNVLGAVRVNGPHTNIIVPLLRSTAPGLSYAVELYRDDGGGTFDLATDSVYVDFETGSPVISYFTTTK
jgi:hypothetical protein